METIKVDNISFGYSSQMDIINNINLVVKEKEFICIVGENGSGKSTLIKCILGLNKVTKGSVTVNERIGYLPQITDIQNNFPATIGEIILSGTIQNNINKIWYSKKDKEISNNIMNELGLYDIRKKCFSEISGGQRQRVLIARALCSTDKIILLDEPVNGLDPKIAVQIYELLYKLNQEKGITVIMVSHDIDRALSYCSRVIEIKNGKVDFDDVPSKFQVGGTK
jgi:zinc transport system ATP-binding protein